MYPSISSTVYDWSEIATFSYPLVFNALVEGVPIVIPGKRFGPEKTTIMGLLGSEDSLTIG